MDDDSMMCVCVYMYVYVCNEMRRFLAARCLRNGGAMTHVLVGEAKFLSQDDGHSEERTTDRC